jgi:hypothetical protein
MQRQTSGRFGRWQIAATAAAVALAATVVCAQDPPKTPAAEKAPFEVVLLSLKSDWQAMRFHMETGEAWYAFQGNWKPVPEADNNKPPDGEYRVQMSKTSENDWIAIRLEKKSGRTWRLAALKWVEMKVLEPDQPKDDKDLKL